MQQMLRGKLKETFGYEKFRPLQEDIIHSTFVGIDVLSILPTGYGKSLCYQLPGAIECKATLIISPLLSLMEDQVRELKLLGLTAACIGSHNTWHENLAILTQFRQGKLAFVINSFE